jgi:N-acetylneuraminic acid mutarotase
MDLRSLAMLKKSLFLTLLITTGIFLCSCSGSGSAVSQPEVQDEQRAISNTNHYCWGLWQGIIDPDAETIDFVKLREGNLHLNALGFLEPPALVYLSLESLDFNGDIITADVGLRHPFLGLNEFTGFDVCGIFITSGSVSGFDNAALVMTGEGDTRLLNPDGYSRWWNPAEFPSNDTIFGYKDGMLGTPDSVGDFDCTLNAYKYFCDDLDDITDTLADVDPTGRGVFSAGQKNIRRYEIEMSDGLVFNYAIDASWQFPSGSPPWNAPDDFADEANRPEAWRVDISEISNTLYYDELTSSGGGNLSLSIDVYDWFNAGLNSVSVESSDVFSSSSSPTPVGGGVGYSTYELDVIGASPVQAGELTVLITVESEIEGFGGFIPGIPTSSYFIHLTNVNEGGANEPPVADASNTGPICGMVPVEVALDPDGSYDPDGTIVLYEWDVETDSIYDYSNTDGAVIYHTFTSAGEYEITLRVTDDGGATNTDSITGDYDIPGPLTYVNLPNMPTARERPFVAEIDDLIYVIGGCTGAYTNPTGTVEVFDPDDLSWSTGYTPMPHPTCAGSTGVIDGIIYCAGGGPGIHNQLQGYDVENDVWLTGLASSPTARVNTAGAVLDGKLYVMGGYNGGAKNAVEAYDPVTNTWALAPSSLAARNAPGAVSYGGKLYLFGGFPLTSGPNYETIEAFDPSTSSWSYLPGNMPDARGTGAWAITAGKIYYFGGLNSAYTFTTSVHSYDIVSEAWNTENSLADPWIYQRAATYCGEIYMFGGIGPTWSSILNRSVLASF